MTALAGNAVAMSEVGAESWIDLMVGAAAGELTFFLSSPGADYNFLSETSDDERSRFPSSLSRAWKQVVIPFAAGTGPRTIRIPGPASSMVWMDAVQFHTANAAFTQWTATRGLPGVDSMEDSDGDGVPRLLEYAFGLDPNGPNAADSQAPPEAGLPTFKLVPDPAGSSMNLLQCTFLRRSGGTAPRYDVYFSHDLNGPWTMSNAATAIRIDDTWERITILNVDGLTASGKRFGRVKVTLE